MRITQETLTVIADAKQREIGILLSGMRITLDADEAQDLSGQLIGALEQVASEGSSDMGRRRNQRSTKSDGVSEQDDDTIPGISALVDQAV